MSKVEDFMSIVRYMVNRVKRKHLLYSQVLFTALAFFIMVVLSYFFARNIVNTSLTRYAESVLSFAQTRIEADLQEAETTLGGFSQTVRTMVLHGDGAEDLQHYIYEITEFIMAGGTRGFKANTMFAYIEAFPDGPVFINGTSWGPPDGYDPESRPWYTAAVAAGGEVVETLPYSSIMSGTPVITYARGIYNDEGVLLGVVCLEMQAADIGAKIVDISLEQGGHGMLFDQYMNLIAHKNPAFVGLNMEDPRIPLSGYADEIAAGEGISEMPVVNWTGEDSVAYVKRLQNGWYLGLLAPKGPFFQGVTDMMLILCALGVTLSAVLIGILVRIDMAKNRADMESMQKSAFLANMSHEIRTPMNAIIGMTTIGKSALDIERKDYCLSKIEDASVHLLGVINDILDVSKIEANKFELSPEEFTFEKMLQSVVSVINFRVNEKQQDLSVHIDKSIPGTLIGDDQRLAQVISNLLSNAVKFTPESGSIKLEARLLKQEANRCSIQIAVTDTGIGISQEQQALLFRSFQQAESSTTRKYGGTGLGLSISKSIVEMMSGEIWVESVAGEGSSFIFRVILQVGAEKEHRAPLKNKDLSGTRALIIDDNVELLVYLSELIREFGMICDTAESAEDALDMVEQTGPYDICFVDWSLPGMDGVTLTSALKAKATPLDKTVVIMMSAFDWHLIENEARRAGVDMFLSKPVFPSDIADAFSEIYGIKQLHFVEEEPDVTGIFGGWRILLAEDVEINREIVAALLEPTALEIDFAENGVEAVRIFNESPEAYDMVFMDVQMPIMDGYEATRQIRASGAPNAGTIPIIALTANVFREDVERCLEAGMSDHIGKPLDCSKVVEKLRAHLLCDRNKQVSAAAS